MPSFRFAVMPSFLAITASLPLSRTEFGDDTHEVSHGAISIHSCGRRFVYSLVSAISDLLGKPNFLNCEFTNNSCSAYSIADGNSDSPVLPQLVLPVRRERLWFPYKRIEDICVRYVFFQDLL
mgnify:CR=1 FL=1